MAKIWISVIPKHNQLRNRYNILIYFIILSDIIQAKIIIFLNKLVIISCDVLTCYCYRFLCVGRWQPLISLQWVRQLENKLVEGRKTWTVKNATRKYLLTKNMNIRENSFAKTVLSKPLNFHVPAMTHATHGNNGIVRCPHLLSRVDQ